MTPCILVADDSPSMRQLLCQTLAGAGYQPLPAQDAADALAQASVAERLDLALVDYHLPGLDGPALIQALRQQPRTRFIPILVVSTETRRERREAARRSGATGWVVKPFQPEELLVLVRRLLGPQPVEGGAP